VTQLLQLHARAAYCALQVAQPKVLPVTVENVGSSLQLLLRVYQVRATKFAANCFEHRCIAFLLLPVYIHVHLVECKDLTGQSQQDLHEKRAFIN
jgi:hypothetical protein